MPVTFHTEEINFDLKQKLPHKRWINLWIETQNAVCGDISYVFTSNKRIKLINQQYLNHNYFTDVITFDYTEDKQISGDIFFPLSFIDYILSQLTGNVDDIQQEM